MVKYVCDICGKEIDTTLPRNHGTYSKYKLKNYTFEWGTWYWKNLMIHNTCWKSMCDYIKNSQEEHGS